MVRCLIWGKGKTFAEHFNTIRFWEECGQIKINGIVAKDALEDEYYRYDIIKKELINKKEIDAIIVMANDINYFNIHKEIVEDVLVDENMILPYKIFCIPDFNVEKYIEIKKDIPTIFANSCWGGITYNRLGLPFMSPFINLYMKDEFYLRFLENPTKYMEEPLIYKKMKYAPITKKYYPICTIGDVELRFNHYTTYEECVDAWERRKKRINWDNLIVEMHTSDKQIAKKFLDLPYKRKICFVPFEEPHNEMINMGRESDTKENPLWKSVTDSAKGIRYCYDILELLLKNK